MNATDRITVKKLSELGKKIVDEISKGQNPSIEIPIRSLSNINFDESAKTLHLGEKVSKRYFFNLAHSRKFMQTVMVAAFCKSLVEEGIHTSIRDMYYNLKHTIAGTKENTFDEQSESDPIIVDLEVSLDLLRENLHLTTDRKGVVAGKVKIRDRGDIIDWSKLGSGGWSIPATVNEIEFRDVDAEFVLVVEKNAGFERLHEDKFWEKHKSIIIGTGGQASRGTRLLIQRLNKELGLPVYVMTDADSYGWYIYSVIKFGSMNLAHISDRIATPKAKFIGVTLSDIFHYGIEKLSINAKDIDIKRAKELMKYEWFAKSKKWQKEFKLMVTKKVKAELEILSSKGLKFMTQQYLPEKLETGDFLD